MSHKNENKKHSYVNTTLKLLYTVNVAFVLMVDDPKKKVKMMMIFLQLLTLL